MWANLHFPGNLVTFTEEILNRKLHFLCSANKAIQIKQILKKQQLENLKTSTKEFFIQVETLKAVLLKLVQLYYFLNDLPDGFNTCEDIRFPQI